MASGTLLIAEDDGFLQEVLADFFAEADFDVLTADNGFEAILELNAESARIDAIVTDIQLGAGPSGWDVGRRARRIIPHVPIVYISGDSLHEWPTQGVPGSVCLAKPFAPSEIIAKITALLKNDPGIGAA